MISVVIPCVNEALTIERCVKDAATAISQLGFQSDVIVVDNNSTDFTAQAAASSGARVLTCHLQGYGAAIKTGINAARGKIVILGDGDGSYDFRRLDEFILPLLTRPGLVNGNRFNYQSPMVGAMPWLHRWFGNPLLTHVVNLLFQANIKDAQCGLRSFHRSIYTDIEPRSNGFEACNEMIIRAIVNDVPIWQTDVILSPTHPLRSSKLRTIKDGLRHLLLALSYFTMTTFLKFSNQWNSFNEK